MPQPKSSSSSSRSSSSRSSSATSRSTAAKKGAATRKAATNKRSATAKKGAATRTAATKPPAQKAAVETTEGARVQLTQLRDALRRGVVVATGSLKEAMDDAVKRGQITRKDATALTQNIVSTGRAQADGLRAGIEQLLGKGTSRAAQSGDVALR